MREKDTEHTLKCEEIAIISLQAESYRNPDFRESRLHHATSSYLLLLQKHFSQKSSAKIAYDNATQCIEKIEKEQKELERIITDERFKLKTKLNDTTSLTFRKPTKRNVGGSSCALASDLLSTLLKKFNQFSHEKSQLQLRAKTLLSRLVPYSKKLAPHTVTGVGLWKTTHEVSRNTEPQASESNVEMTQG